MLSLLHIVGLGPCLDIAIPFDPDGATTLEGGSECGKSTSIDATCFVLWECDRSGRPLDVRQITDGQPRCEIEIQTGKGSILRRTLTTSRSATRAIVAPDGSVSTFPSADAMGSKLGAVGQHAAIGRIIVAPMQWLPLLAAELGRPFRDLVMSVLPAGDLRATVAGMMTEAKHALGSTDNLDVKSALVQQSDANSQRDVVRGRLQAAEARVAALAAGVPSAPAPAALAAAQATLALSTEWAGYDMRVAGASAEVARHEAAVSAHILAMERHAAAVKARDDWRARSAALGDRPVVDAMALRAHKEQLVTATAAQLAAERAHRDAEQAVVDATRNLATVREKLAKLREAGSNCPTCKRGEWAGAMEMINKVHGEVDDRQHALALDEANIGPAAEALTARTAELARIRSAGDAFAAPEMAIASYDAGVRALGPEPLVALPPAAPVAPASTSIPTPKASRPDAEAHRAAVATVDEARTATAMAQRHAADKAAATKAVVDTQAALDAAERECKRVVVLVDCARRAPTEIARQQAAALGDMGCVSLRFPPKENKQTPEIEVLVDGRPWHLASEGRQVYADALLRCALRRAAATTIHPAFAKLPIFVDRVQSWSGGWDGIEGATVYLVTTPAIEESDGAGGVMLVEAALSSSAQADLMLSAQGVSIARGPFPVPYCDPGNDAWIEWRGRRWATDGTILMREDGRRPCRNCDWFRDGQILPVASIEAMFAQKFAMPLSPVRLVRHGRIDPRTRLVVYQRDAVSWVVDADLIGGAEPPATLHAAEGAGPGDPLVILDAEGEMIGIVMPRVPGKDDLATLVDVG